jgi:hypothetical protein
MAGVGAEIAGVAARSGWSRWSWQERECPGEVRAREARARVLLGSDTIRAAGFYWVEPWAASPGEWVVAEWVAEAGGVAFLADDRHWLLPGDENWWGSGELVGIDEVRLERVAERAAG